MRRRRISCIGLAQVNKNKSHDDFVAYKFGVAWGCLGLLGVAWGCLGLLAPFAKSMGASLS